MKKPGQFKLPISNHVVIGIVAGVIVIVCATVLLMFNSRQGQTTKTHSYSTAEQQLAEDVRDYLSLYVDLSEGAAAAAADAAVNNYRIIAASDTDMVNDDHTEAIYQRVEKKMLDILDEDGQTLDADEIDLLASGVAEIVWNHILAGLKNVTQDSDQGTDYDYLIASIQEQIDQLEKRKMKVSIQANINSGTADLTSEDLLAMIEGMTDQEIEELAASLGLSRDELYDLLSLSNEELDQEMKELIEKIKEELIRELTNKISGTSGADGKDGAAGRDGKDGEIGKTGTDGKNGEDGADGEDGQDGKDGENGEDGANIFIRYAEDASGKNMTETPGDNTKYMGTYSGKVASTNPSDYTWTRYSDATISYSNGTLYITQ